jgi:membrane-bound metal-dependent hydrolase YbcI (DUF457 family)
MMGKTHVAGGMISGATALLLLQNSVPELTTIQTGLCVGISTTLFSSLSARLPDIDKKESTIGRQLWFISWPIFLLQCICKLPSMLGIKIFKNVSKVVDHRGFTHFPNTWLLITAMAAVYSYSIYGLNYGITTRFLLISPAVGLSLGILSHLILDFFSGKIKLFAPLSLKGYGIPIIKRNSLLELILRMALYMGTFKILAMYWTNIV